MPRAVRLRRGTTSISATDVLASETRIPGTVLLDQPPSVENRDVVVEFEDGTEARLSKAFAITTAKKSAPSLAQHVSSSARVMSGAMSHATVQNASSQAEPPPATSTEAEPRHYGAAADSDVEIEGTESRRERSCP